MCEPTSQEPDFFNHLGHMNDLRKYKPRKRQPSNREELPDFEGNESDVINLSEEEIQEELQSLVEDMNLKKPNDKDYIMEVTDCIEDIDTFFFTHPTSRKNIGDYLAELNFAEIVLNVMRKLTDEEMKLESFWDQYYFAYISCYHYSLNSTKFAKSLIDNDILQLLTSNLTRKDFLENIESEQSVVFILEISLQIINKLARSTHLKNTFEIIQISEAIKHLLAINKEETLNFVAELTLIYIGETPDQPENFIKQLLSTLQMALDDTNCRAEKGFYPWELIHCLSRLSSLNLITGDLIQVDLLNNLKRMILDNVNEEQRAAAECLWHLGFDNSILKKIQHEDDLNNALKSIANSEDSLVKENAQGALWIIQEKYKNVPETHQTGENSDVVFLSFHDDDKKPVETLCSELQSMGYTVIQDHTRIDESDFFDMCTQLAHVSKVIVCLTDSFRDSPYCRTVAELALINKKKTQVIKLKNSFNLDGWLASKYNVQSTLEFADEASQENCFKNLWKFLSKEQRGIKRHLSPELSVAKRVRGGKDIEKEFCRASLEYIAKSSCTDLTFNNKTFSFDEDNIALLEMRTAIKNVNPLIDTHLEDNKDAISLALLIKCFVKKIMKEVTFEVVDKLEQQEVFKKIQESVNNILYFPEKLKKTFLESLTSGIKDKSKLHTKSENRNKLINVEVCEYQCAIFGLNENFVLKLSNLGPMGLEHGNILYFFSTWLESYWQEMISETNHNPYDHESNFKKLGINSDVSEILSRRIKTNVREMQTSLYWAKSYLETVWFSHPLISQCNNEFLPTEVDKWIECREIIEKRLIELSNKTAKGHIKLFRASKQSKLTDLEVKREYCIENKDVYYHGTEQYCLYGERGKDGILSKGIDLKKGNGKQDFSHRCGFYLSDTLDAARKWGGYKSPNDHCVIVFAIPKELLNAQSQGGLDVTSDDKKWGRVVDYFRNGESNTESNFNDSELNEINNAKFIKGNISKRDKSAYTINNIVVRQICLKEKEYAQRIESCICAIIFYHTEN